MELTLGLAFIAGLVSFISPCVLPLVPAYVGYMGGRITSTVATDLRVGTTGQPQSVGRFRDLRQRSNLRLTKEGKPASDFY